MKVICLSDFKREKGEIKSCGCSLLFREFEEPGLVAKRTFGSSPVRESEPSKELFLKVGAIGSC